MTNRGFTLVELLVAVAVMAILATALTRMMLSDSRFVSKQEAMMAARQTARAAQNVMSVELRMVSTGGLLAASADSIRVRVPYAFGMACNNPGATAARIASLMPTDSLMYASAIPDGVARLAPDGEYHFTGGITVSAATDSTMCSMDGIHVVEGGSLVAITPNTAALRGDLFYLYQTITYRLSASTDLPGRRGLWRRVGNGAYEEIVAPFDSTARFRFLVGSNPEPTDVLPADTNTVTGLELKFVTQSFVRPQGDSDFEKFDMPVIITFLNGAG